MYLGVEIGGTKLQLGVGRGDGQLVDLERTDVDVSRGAAGILQSIDEIGSMLVQRYGATKVGFGFGGPINRESGRVITSHQIAGWENFPLADWCQQTLGLPAILGNDCDSAALAEAAFGAGRGKSRVFYVTVGTGIGGGFVVDQIIQGTDRPAFAEIGHLRPGPTHQRADETVESIASGWGIVALTRQKLEGFIAQSLSSVRSGSTATNREQWRAHLENLRDVGREFEADLLARCENNLDQLTAKMIAQAADEGNEVACEVLAHATETLGWAIAQVITLLSPHIVVVGGGVSLMPRSLFWDPLQKNVARFVFPPLADAYELQPAALGEEVVVQGALALCTRR